MEFKWKSFRTLYLTIISINVIISAVLNAYKHFHSGSIKASTINGVIFHASSAISCVLFHQLDWKRFTIEWCRVESIFLDDKCKHPPLSRSLKQKIYLYSVVGFVASLLNQVLYVAAETQKILYISHECNCISHNFLQDYIVEHLRHIFHLIPYNHFFGG